MQQITDPQQTLRIAQIRQRVRDEGIQPLKKTKSQTDKTFILTCLKNHFIFYNLSDRELDNVKEHMFWAEMPEGTELFRQGTIGTCFYIIQHGSVEIRADEEVTKLLKANEGFGQLALLYEIQRPTTAIVKQRCGFWIIDKVGFREAVEQIVISEFESNQKFLESMAFYQFLRPQQKQKVASSFVTLKYYKGQNIVEEGDPGSSFYVIKEGTACLLQGNLEERKIYKGESFGHNSLYYNTMRKMTVRAQEDVVCQVLGRETLAKIIGADFRQVMFKNYVKHVVQKNRNLFTLLKKDEQTFFEGMKVQYKKNNEVVFRKGTTVQRLLIVMEGKLKKSRSANYLAEAGQTWGEVFLSEAVSSRLEDDVIVETESVLIELSLMAIKNIQTKYESLSLQQPQDKASRIDEVDPRDIQFLYEMDKGSESRSLLLKFQDKLLLGKLYKKKDLQKNNLTQIVNQEMQVSAIAEHPFLPHFQQLIDYDRYLLKISEFIQGESLYDSIRQIGLLSSSDTQFFAASLILLLEYFMTKEIVVRDLKPDNLIVDQKGYLKLISFGSAKLINTHHRTNTVIGTPHYMAPEIVLGKEYNELVDLWSVGVMLYEFMVGQLPFGSTTENPYQIYETIIQGDVQFPRNFRDRRAKKLIETMLNLNPEARYNGSYSNLKTNPWFENINWDDLLIKNIAAPYKPTKSKQTKPIANPIPLPTYLQNL